MTPRLIAWLVGVGIVAVLGAIFLGGPIVSFLQGQVKHWQAREETATDTAVSNGAETDASQALGNAQSQIAEQVIERHTETVRYVEKASAAPDAKTPLGPDRQRRVDGHSDGLCQRRPSVCSGGTSATGSDAGVR
jgi:hypothetical protein